MRIPGEESEQGLENLFEEIITENYPNLVKEEVSGSSKNPRQVGPKEAYIKPHYNSKYKA